MRRRIALVALAISLAAGSLLAGGAPQLVSANAQLEKKIQDIQTERTEKQKESELTEAEIAKIEREMRQLEEEMRTIDHQVADTNEKIRVKQQEIEAVRVYIEQLKEELRILEERIAERDSLLKERARTMYQNGGSVNYLEVILGARSFGDFLDRVSALSVIAQQDRNILEAHLEDQRLVEETKALVEGELEKLEGHLIELERLMATLDDQRKQKDAIMSQLEQREDELHADLGELEQADEILAAQERAMKQELEAFKERERQRQQEQQRQAQSGGSSGSSHAAPEVTREGDFMRPATGRITSGYGPRATFGGRMHHGIDIGKNGRTGDVPIVAAEAGTVIRSYYSSSYGNTVMISHNVNGQVITTLYAHLENREVSNGDRVEKGQRLGFMGNTGRSFGPHLHFEVHEGPWNQNKTNAVNPMKYIPN
ncbi:murein hydrolase activator EnvC family protein [Bacillus sp. FJAT-45350]|uniref:murein hydrolase activator EnvC family protein n=1 Tax=Bacillus sp. FJAT-45350 TaxID=2011014 RepID=UPI000BB6819A|nr:peptidoglycan DD-metalloendopeptidase family protein [Bacillus sp. FJAT-45350]